MFAQWNRWTTIAAHSEGWKENLVYQAEKNALGSAKSETQILCAFLAGLRYEQLPLDVVSKPRWSSSLPLRG